MSGSDSSGNGSNSGERELRERMTSWAAETGPAPDLDSLYADLQRDIGEERGPGAWLRQLSTPARYGIALAAVAALAAGTSIGWLRPDHAVYPSGRMAAIGLFIVVLGAVELLLALWPLHRPALPAWLGRAAIATGLLGLFALYAMPAAHLAHPASVQLPGAHALVSKAMPCLAIGLGIALAGYLLLRGLDRGGVRRALLAAACAGLGANLALQIHCPVTAPSHMLIGHFGVAALFVAGVSLLHARR